MLDALPYAAWSEAQQLNALAGQTTPEPVQATPATKPDHDRVVETTGLCTPDNPFGLEEMELAAVRYYYWQDIPRLSTENFSDPMMMHLEEVMPQERDAWLDSLEGPQMRSLSNEEYQASIEATRAIERQKDEAVWRDSFHYKAAFSLQDAEMMAAADVAFAPLAARIGQGLSKLYWGVRGEQAATNAALRAELRMALEADFKLYAGGVPSISVAATSKLDDLTAAFAKGPNKATFANDELLAGHFKKHGAEFRAQSAEEYLQVGQDIMQHGHKIKYFYEPANEVRTGYVSFMRNSKKSGESLFGFVGTNSDRAITTIHVKPRTELFDLLGDSAQSRLKIFRTDTVGPAPQSGWKYPYK
jgi:hypothetical protein